MQLIYGKVKSYQFRSAMHRLKLHSPLLGKQFRRSYRQTDVSVQCLLVFTCSEATTLCHVMLSVFNEEYKQMSECGS